MKKFNKQEEENILQAIRKLEKNTSGEFVPYISKISDDYDEGTWFFASIVSLFIFASLAIASYLWLIPNQITFFVVGLYSLILLSICILACKFSDKFRLLFVSAEKKHERVMSAAETAFLEEEVFNTNHRTGILLYISIAEKEVVIMGDSGINSQVKFEDWKAIVDIVITGIKEKKIAESMVKAIESSEKLLLEHRFPASESPENELSDRIRYRY
ncbi:TPM domain-containing protein [Marinigracilibium pacificum]|uniref:TPM domain-containing protein n=1 Tax=Marinigracilibium pacificum TaxID=2729599 RepID=A0A848JAE2_9BACT|nr:hypothetical protein [Marinigracilibium pacificum]NMM50012.1 hypothetical protein [Marinigracilibium pacificum]